MSTCPRCGAENYINTCEDCGFEQTRDVLSYYTLTRLGDEELSFFDTTERLVKKCIKQLELLNKHLRRQGKKELDTDERIVELFDEYVSLTESQPEDEYESKSAEREEVKRYDYNFDEDPFDAIFKIFNASRETPKPEDEYAGKSAEELYKLGEELYDGQGKEADYIKAFELFSLAAEKGNADAMYILGFMYYSGNGVTQDKAQAFEWLKKAAEKGLAEPMNTLGEMYYYGDGVTQDYARAFEWYKKAAEKGNAKAMNNLANMYKKGQGVARDKQKAEEWKRKAEAARR